MLTRIQIAQYEAVRAGDVWKTAAGEKVRCDGHVFVPPPADDPEGFGAYKLQISRLRGGEWVQDPALYEDETSVR